MPTTAPDWPHVSAVLFDLDGVLTPTAEVHMQAWSEMFNAYLEHRNETEGEAQPPYTDEDYHAHVDGKPRYDGVRDFLTSRNIELPEGDPSDPPTEHSICGLGNRKNEAFNAVLTRDGVRPYPGSVAFLDHLADLDMKIAVVSSSANAPAVLSAAGLEARFEVVVDGRVARERGLPGKPAPDTFQHAAALLDVDAAGCVVVEDAVSGVKAGASGGFSATVGVDRGAGAETLLAAGADLVVSDLQELI